MDRVTRNLLQLKDSNIVLSSKTPTKSNMRNGEKRFVIVDGTLRMYVKQNNILWYIAYTKV